MLPLQLQSLLCVSLTFCRGAHALCNTYFTWGEPAPKNSFIQPTLWTDYTAKTRVATAPVRGPLFILPSSRWGLPSAWIYPSAWKWLGHATGYHWLSLSCMSSSALYDQESFSSHGQGSIFCHRNSVIGGMTCGKRQASKDYSSLVPSVSLGVWPKSKEAQQGFLNKVMCSSSLKDLVLTMAGNQTVQLSWVD